MDFEFRWVRYGDRDVPAPIPTYAYTACDVSKREFRLLEILPASLTDKQELLSCKLHHHSLDDNPPFVALSYECGDPSIYECISVDESSFPVTLNLYHALHQLRARNCYLVWIDAICIHQVDMTEKSEHILMMKDIYHSASHVVVWLGEAEFNSDKVMEMLNAIDKSRDPERSNGHAPWTPNWQQLQNIKPELVAFLKQRTYWQRAWIVQEVAMASRVVLFCGERSARWRGLEQLVDVILKTNAFPDMKLQHMDHLCLMRLNRIKGIPVGLLSALCGGSECKASMLQDRVYAVLGLIFDQAAFVPRVDYTWPVTTMCTELTKSWILSHKSLDVILAGGANNRTARERIPSWMPSYLHMENSHILQRLSSYIAGQDRRYRCGRMCSKWSASESSLVERGDIDIDDKNQLCLRGVCIGFINGLGAVLDDTRPIAKGPRDEWKTDRSDDELEETICGSFALYEREYEALMDKQNFLGVLFNFDSIAYGLMKSQELKARFNKLVEWRNRNEDFEIRGKRLSSWSTTFASAVIQADAWLTVPRFIDQIGGLTQNLMAVSSASPRPTTRRVRRNVYSGVQKKHNDVNMTASLQNFADLVDEGLRLMITDYGDMGWVHPAAEIGDRIVLLKGCSVPVVIRPVHSTGTAHCISTATVYQLIGHAYCHGFMSGEAWSTPSFGHTPIFSLRCGRHSRSIVPLAYTDPPPAYLNAAQDECSSAIAQGQELEQERDLPIQHGRRHTAAATAIATPSQVIHKSAKYPRVAVLLGVNKHYYIPLLLCRSLSTLFALWWAGLTASKIYILVMSSGQYRKSTGGAYSGHHAGSSGDNSPFTQNAAIHSSTSLSPQILTTRLMIAQLFLAYLWACNAAYISHLFASSLMSRWLQVYSPLAVLVRLCSVSIVLSYSYAQIFLLSGTMRPNLRDLSASLPIWVLLNVGLLLSYFWTQHDISVEADKDDRRRRLVLRVKCLYAVAATSLCSVLVLVAVIRLDNEELDLKWAGVWKNDLLGAVVLGKLIRTESSGS